MNQSRTMSKPQIDPLWLLLILGPLGSLAGCAALLRSGQELTRRAFWTAILNSGIFSLGVATLMLWRFGTEEIWLTCSVSIFAGLGGNAAIDFALAALMQYARDKTIGDQDGNDAND